MSFYGQEQIQQVREATDLVELLQERTRVMKAGQDFVACCPFHGEKTPSLHVYASERRFYCFGCKERGDAIDVVMKLDNVDFEQAVATLARRGGVKLVPQGGAKARAKADDRSRQVAVMEWAAAFYADLLASPDAAAARDYLSSRGFTDATLSAFAVGWAPGRGALMRAAQTAGHSLADLEALDLVKDGRDRFFDRITIPIRDRRGQVVGFTARLLPAAEAAAKADGRGVGKYINSRETPLYVKGETLFNSAGAQLGRRAGRCFVVEGPLDAMASWQAGVKEVVATCGTALTSAHAAHLAHALGDAQLILAFDGDDAGRRALDGAMATCLAAGLMPRSGQLPGGKDAAAVLSSDGTDALRLAWDSCQQTAVPALRWLLSAHPIPTPAPAEALLALLDDMLAICASIPDQRIVELEWLQQIADHLGIPLKTVRDTWKREAKPAKSAPAGDAAPAAQGQGDYAQMVGRLHAFIAATKAKPDAMCGWIGADDAPADLSDNDVQLDFSHGERMSGQRLVDIELRQASTVVFNGYRKARRQELLSRIIGKPATEAGRNALRNWLRGATGECRELDYAVMSHFIWQAKRLGSGRVADWPLIPVLFGGQEVGKSTAVERLCQPLAELSFPIDATSITDERKSLVITRALVGRLEEMAGMAKADQEKLKAMATANRTMFRELYSMSLQQRRRTCSFIASSNLSLDAIVTDTTGNRRFYQIDCLKKDWDLMNATDPLLIWQAVSEDDPAPIKEHKNDIAAEQRRLVHQDVVALWLRHETWDAMRIRRPDHDEPMLLGCYNPDIGVTVDELASRCAYWARGASNSPPTLPRLIQRLRQEGLENRKVTLRHGQRGYRWFVPDRWRSGEDRRGDIARRADAPDQVDPIAPPSAAAPVCDFPEPLP
jgi:DNA primase